MNSKVFSPYSLTIVILRDNVQSSSIKKLHAKKTHSDCKMCLRRQLQDSNHKFIHSRNSDTSIVMDACSKPFIQLNWIKQKKKQIRPNSCLGRIHLQTSRSIVKAIQIHLTSCNSTISSLHPWNDIHMDRETNT